MARDRPEQPPPAPPPRESDVILDVEFGAGLLFLVVRNLGDLPALNVRIALEPTIRGLGGARSFGALPLFRRLEFLGPRREIRVFLDRAALYFARGEATAFDATVRWRTRSGERRTEVVRHDLEIYRDLPYVESEVES